MVSFRITTSKFSKRSASLVKLHFRRAEASYNPHQHYQGILVTLRLFLVVFAPLILFMGLQSTGGTHLPILLSLGIGIFLFTWTTPRLCSAMALSGEFGYKLTANIIKSLLLESEIKVDESSLLTYSEQNARMVISISLPISHGTCWYAFFYFYYSHAADWFPATTVAGGSVILVRLT